LLALLGWDCGQRWHPAAVTAICAVEYSYRPVQMLQHWLRISIQGRDERRIEHPTHTTPERQKRHSAEVSPVGEWSSGRTSEHLKSPA
jgi:hypothetical protein